MTAEEFRDRYAAKFNLGKNLPLDMIKAFGESLGLPMKPGEMHSDYLDRIADHIEQAEHPNPPLIDSRLAGDMKQGSFW